jgi:hypothetical protein
MSTIDTQPSVRMQARMPVQTKPLLAGRDGRPLRRVWLRLILFLLPVAFLAPAIYWVDPYGLFGHRSPVPVTTRAAYGQQLNQVLWKIPAYNRDPKPNILLGDSQMARLPEEEVSAVTGQPFANMAYGGGTLRESISTFWFASRRTSLQRVYFGISFADYNGFPLDRVITAEDILSDRGLYFINSDVLEAGVYDIEDAEFHHRTDLMPKVSREAFWQSQLQYLATRYKRFADPGSLRDDLRKIVAYCNAHNIAFTFVITPQHIDAQRRVRELGVEDQYEQFKKDLAGMAPVYDCDIDSSLTRNRDNYSDPFHLSNPGASQLVSDLWSAHPTLCRSIGMRH